jgi:hypothetical protein
MEETKNPAVTPTTENKPAEPKVETPVAQEPKPEEKK